VTSLEGVDPALPGEDRPLARPGGAAGVRLASPRAGDRMWMARALEQARAAALAGEVPVGAVLVHDGRLVAEGFNRTVTRPDPTAHAEVEVLRAGAIWRGDWRLDGCTLYVTLEPCAQCAGAVVLARIDRLVYAASDEKAGMAGSLGNLLQDARLNHRVVLVGGVLAEEGGAVLRSFFRTRRREAREGGVAKGSEMAT
jgi:tRNA(Arg) A34 adenosine deaminase TadA